MPPRTLLTIAFAALISLCVAGRADSVDASPVLLFNGEGTSPTDVAAIESILDGMRLSYSEVNSGRLNHTSMAQLNAHRLLIVPGGNFEVIGKGLARETSANIRKAVEAGLSYLGLCAGAFFGANSPYNGLNLTSGVRFAFYSAENRGIRKAAVTITDAGSGTLDQYWEDGPQLSGWGLVIAKYPDGAPAVVEGSLGRGWIVFSGVHPEAPAAWRRGMTFRTPASASHAYAARLISAALKTGPPCRTTEPRRL